MGALIDYLQRNYKWDDTLAFYILEKEDYEEACHGSSIPWERGAHIISDDQNWEWLTPEIYNTMSRIIGEEEEDSE